MGAISECQSSQGRSLLRLARGRYWHRLAWVSFVNTRPFFFSCDHRKDKIKILGRVQNSYLSTRIKKKVPHSSHERAQKLYPCYSESDVGKHSTRQVFHLVKSHSQWAFRSNRQASYNMCYPYLSDLPTIDPEIIRSQSPIPLLWSPNDIRLCKW